MTPIEKNRRLARLRRRALRAGLAAVVEAPAPDDRFNDDDNPDGIVRELTAATASKVARPASHDRGR